VVQRRSFTLATATGREGSLAAGDDAPDALARLMHPTRKPRLVVIAEELDTHCKTGDLPR
jgi:hypothetical protein